MLCICGPARRKDLLSALGGTRTPNLLIRSQMLYPIELRAPIGKGILSGVASGPHYQDELLVPRP